MNTSNLMFPVLGIPQHWKVFVFSDAIHASFQSGASHETYLAFIEGNKISTIASSLPSETMALAEQMLDTLQQ